MKKHRKPRILARALAHETLLAVTGGTLTNDDISKLPQPRPGGGTIGLSSDGKTWTNFTNDDDGPLQR